MRSARFLLSRRWALFLVVVALAAWACWWLGEWQFGRLADTKRQNAIITANENRTPAPVGDVLAPGRPSPPGNEWRTVTATGRYDTSGTVLVRYQIRDGASGVDVVVPLVTDEGPSLLVDRGWVASDNNGGDPTPPAPPSGEVTVTGYVRADGTGDSTAVSDGTTRAVSSRTIGAAQDRTVYGGFVDLRSESPAASNTPEPPELPDLSNGPHFFYGLQWWFFGLLAVFGFFYLMYDEWRRGPRGQREAVDQDAVPTGPAGPASPTGTRPGGRDKPRKPKKQRQTNHPYERMRREREAAEAREREEQAAREAEHQDV